MFPFLAEAILSWSEVYEEPDLTDLVVVDDAEAVRLARSLGDPALFVRSAAALLAQDGNDALLAEARSTAARIVAILPTADMRERFEAAEPIRRLGSLA